jgi:hypothetical protein
MVKAKRLVVERLTLSIPEAGAMAGLSPSASYRAADAGRIPTIKMSESRRVVPAKRWRAILDGEASS